MILTLPRDVPIVAVTLGPVLKGSASSGWFAPPKGTHSGEKHRSVGSGKAKAGGKATVKSKPKVGDRMKMNDPDSPFHGLTGTFVRQRDDGSYDIMFERAGDRALVQINVADAEVLPDPKAGAEVDFGERWPHQGPNQWADEQYEGWRKSVTAEEREAISYYTQDGYETLNSELRYGEGRLDPNAQYDAELWASKRGWSQDEIDEFSIELEQDYISHQIGTLELAIQKSSVPEPMVVYRGWGSGSEVGQTSVGEIFDDAGFVSTSLSLPFVRKHFDASGTPIARIHVKQGQKAAFIGNKRFGRTDEAEVLLPYGTSFKVISKTDEFIDMEMVEIL